MRIIKAMLAAVALSSDLHELWPSVGLCRRLLRALDIHFDLTRGGTLVGMASNRKQAIGRIGDRRSAEPGSSPSGQVSLRQAI
jgi:hypothetical protein